MTVKIRSSFETDGWNKFAIVVPAHNEELIISKTLYSLLSLVYPQKYYDIFVIADNCTDQTADISREIGATVFERTDEDKKGKGHALRWGFDKLTEEYNYDAIVVFDADSLISGNFLTVLNWYLENGAEVIQGSDMVQPQPKVWSSEITRIGFTLYNYVRPLGRKALNLSMGLRGNGMCFSTSVIKEVPWESYSLTEDVEYGLSLLLNGIRITFAPEAKVTAKMPENTEDAESQRERWEVGRFPIVLNYFGKLLASVFSTGNPFIYLDALINLLIPPLVNMVIFISGMLVFNLLLALIGVSGALILAAGWSLLIILALLHLFIGFKAASVDKNLYKALWHTPKYALWKMKVYKKFISDGGPKEWIRTSRETSD